MRPGIDPKELDDLTVPPGLFTELAQDALEQCLAPIQIASGEPPLATFEEMRNASNQQQGSVLLNHRVDDDVA